MQININKKESLGGLGPQVSQSLTIMILINMLLGHFSFFQVRADQGYRNLGCLDSKGNFDRKCRCQKSNRCFDIRPDGYFKLNFPSDLRKSMDYVVQTYNMVQSGLIKVEDVDMDKFVYHTQYIKKSFPFMIKRANQARIKNKLAPLDLDLSKEGINHFLNKKVIPSLSPKLVKTLYSKMQDGSFSRSKRNDDSSIDFSFLTSSDQSHSLNKSLPPNYVPDSEKSLDQLVEKSKDQEDIDFSNLEYDSLTIHPSDKLTLFEIISSRYQKIFFSPDYMP